MSSLFNSSNPAQLFLFFTVFCIQEIFKVSLVMTSHQSPEARSPTSQLDHCNALRKMFWKTDNTPGYDVLKNVQVEYAFNTLQYLFETPLLKLEIKI